jgi:hypothetical protein
MQPAIGPGPSSGLQYVLRIHQTNKQEVIGKRQKVSKTDEQVRHAHNATTCRRQGVSAGKCN